jgi:hypothetical protein
MNPTTQFMIELAQAPLKEHGIKYGEGICWCDKCRAASKFLTATQHN